MNLEIPGNQDYVVYATATVADVHNGLICLESEGKFLESLPTSVLYSNSKNRKLSNRARH